MNQEKIIVIDFGGQYNQLVARRVRDCHVYCEIYSYRTPIEQIKAMNPKGIILTGGPNSVYEEGAATCSKELFEMGVFFSGTRTLLRRAADVPRSRRTCMQSTGS